MIKSKRKSVKQSTEAYVRFVTALDTLSDPTMPTWAKCLGGIIKAVTDEPPRSLVTNRRHHLSYFYDGELLNSMKITGIGGYQKLIKEELRSNKALLEKDYLQLGTWQMQDNSKDMCMELDSNLPIAIKAQVIEEYFRILRPGKPAIIEAPNDIHNTSAFLQTAPIIQMIMQGVGFSVPDEALKHYNSGCYVVGLKPLI